MPAPDFEKHRVLKYLRQEFPHGLDLMDPVTGEIWSYDQVRTAVYKLRTKDVDLLRVFIYFMFTPLPRTRIADEVNYDSSTVKRMLDKGVDEILKELRKPSFLATAPVEIEPSGEAHVPDNLASVLDFERTRFLRYLKSDFPAGKPYQDARGGSWSNAEVKGAVNSLRDNGPEILKIFLYHMSTPLSRTRIAEEVDCDSSTVKRMLDKGVDAVMQKLRHGDFPKTALFPVRTPGGLGKLVKFPVTYVNPNPADTRSKDEIYRDDLAAMRAAQSKKP